MLLIVTVNSVVCALYCLSLAFTCGMICWGWLLFVVLLFLVVGCLFSLCLLFWMLVGGGYLDVCGCCTAVTLRADDGFVCGWFGTVLCVVLLPSAYFVVLVVA